MDNWDNILNEDILRYNTCFAAMFIMNYECLKEYVVDQVRIFYSSSMNFEGKKITYVESQEYKDQVRALDEKEIVNASLKWLENAGAISKEDYETFHKIRERRNDIIHQLLKNLNDGFSNNDVSLFSKILEIYSKIDKWWINEIEIPTSGDDIPENYDKESVFGGQALVLSIVNGIILGNEGEKYKELLKQIKDILH